MAAFRNIYTALMLVIAGSTQKQLARQVAYLKCENQLLRSRIPGQVSLTHREKCRLVRFAKHLGASLNELASIVHHPATIRQWVREVAHMALQKRRGRPKTKRDIEALILQMADNNSWRYTRILVATLFVSTPSALELCKAWYRENSKMAKPTRLNIHLLQLLYGEVSITEPVPYYCRWNDDQKPVGGGCGDQPYYL